MQKNILIFLGYFDNPLSALKPIQKICTAMAKENLTIISIGNYLSEELEQGIKAKIIYFDDLLNKADYEYLEDYIITLSENWHKYLPAEESVTKFKDIELLKLMQLDIYMSLCTVLRNLHVILNAISAKNPIQIFLLGERCEDRLSAISNFLSAVLGIRTHYVKVNAKSISLFFNSFKRGLKQSISDIILELLDRIEMSRIASSNGYKNPILMDYRFLHIIKDVEKNYTAISYIVGKGLNLRLRLLCNKKIYLSFLTMGGLLNNSREKRYFSSIENEFKTNFNKDKKYKGHDIYGVLRDIFKRCIETKLPLLRANISLHYNIFEVMKPKIVITRDSLREHEYALISIAKSLGIPSLVIQHGLMSIRHIDSKQNADLMAVWGKADIEWFKSAGNNPSIFEITGSPTHDDIYLKRNGRLDRYRHILREVGADPGKPTIVYLANCISYYPTNSVYVPPDLSVVSLRITLDAFQDFADVQLLIKLHPFYTKSEYPKLEREISKFKNVFVLKDTDIPDLFSGSLAVISELFSAALIDAVILKKPVICYNFAKREESRPFSREGVGIEIKDLRKLKDVIRDIISHDNKNTLFQDADFSRFTENYAYKIDGRSSARIMDLIEKMTRR